jgi:hypothetical protein
VFREGATFSVKADKHLWVIISDPERDPEHVVQVNFTSLDETAPPGDPYNDRSCVLTAGEHQRIIHPTCVNYAGVQITTVSHLEWRRGKRDLTLRNPVTPQVLERIRRGAKISQHIIPLAYDILEQQNLL